MNIAALIKKFLEKGALTITVTLIPLIWVFLISQDKVSVKLQEVASSFLYRSRGELEAPVKIVYVDLDAKAMSVFKEKPWNYTYFRFICDFLNQFGKAKAIGIDIVFSPIAYSEVVPPESIVANYQELSNITQNYDNIVLGVHFSGAQMPYHFDVKEFGLPRKYIDSYDINTNVYPEAPTYPVIGQGWGTMGIISTDDSRVPTATPHWAPMYVETRGLSHSINIIDGFMRVMSGNFEGLHTDPTLEIEGDKAAKDALMSLTQDDTIKVLNADGIPLLELPAIQEKTFYHMSLELARIYLNLGPDSIQHTGNILEIVNEEGNPVLSVPLVDDQLLEINWFSKWISPYNPRVSIKDILDKFAELSVASEEEYPQKLAELQEWSKQFEGSICLIGPVDKFLQDLAPTPFDDNAVPKVGVHGNLLKTIFSGRYITHLPKMSVIAITLLLTLITAVFVLYTGRFSITTKFLSILMIAGYFYLAVILFKEYSLMLPLVAPIACAASTAFSGFIIRLIFEERQRGRIKNMFGTYVSPEIVNQMVESGEEPKLGGVEEHITCFFSDIQSFSSFSEILPPDGLVEIMNEYLTEMTNLLQSHGGTLDKYIGDAIVAMFGAPIKLEGHALKACIATQKMQIRQAELRKKWAGMGDYWPEKVHHMQTRIGLNTGMATVGNMGSESRFNYTFMGDNVNLAARMESGAKAYGAYTMVTEDTKKEAQKDGDDCVFRYLDKIVVKGRTQPVQVYEIVGLKGEVPQETLECLGIFDQAIQKYLTQNWDEASALFAKARLLEPNRLELNPTRPATPSIAMIKRCAMYRQNPPGDDWDGRFVMTSK